MQRFKRIAQSLKVSNQRGQLGITAVAALIIVSLIIVIAIKSREADKCIKIPRSFSNEGLYDFAAVASDADACSQIGNFIMMSKNGTAFDALVATQVCIGAINSMSSGLGGGFMAICYDNRMKDTFSINAREIAPNYFHRTMFNGLSPDAKAFGGLSIGIPLEMKGLYRLYEKYGSPGLWKDLINPTIELIRYGTPVFNVMERTLNDKPYFGNTLKQNPSFIANFKSMIINPLTNDTYKLGEFIQRDNFLKFLERLRDHPEEMWSYEPNSMNAMISLDLKDVGLDISAKELAEAQPTFGASEKVELETNYNGDRLTLHAVPPPSSGTIIGLVLNIMKNFNQTSESVFKKCTSSSIFYHRFAEAMKIALEVRQNFSDTTFTNVTETKETLEKIKLLTFAKEMHNIIKDTTNRKIKTKKDFHDAGTGQVSVVDRFGNACSSTPTINYPFGSLVVGKRTGLIFNNQMDDFDVPEGTFNDEDLLLNAFNVLERGKRPLSSTSPIIITERESKKLRLVAGAIGGPKIPAALSAVLFANIYLGMDIKEAIDMYRIYPTLDILKYEKGFSKDVLKNLENLGHTIRMHNSTPSAVVVIEVESENNPYIDSNGSKFKIKANSDYRKGASVAGF